MVPPQTDTTDIRGAPPGNTHHTSVLSDAPDPPAPPNAGPTTEGRPLRPHPPVEKRRVHRTSTHATGRENPSARTRRFAPLRQVNLRMVAHGLPRPYHTRKPLTPLKILYRLAATQAVAPQRVRTRINVRRQRCVSSYCLCCSSCSPGARAMSKHSDLTVSLPSHQPRLASRFGRTLRYRSVCRQVAQSSLQIEKKRRSVMVITSQSDFSILALTAQIIASGTRPFIFRQGCGLKKKSNTSSFQRTKRSRLTTGCS